MASPTQEKFATVDRGVKVFYREAFPASSTKPSDPALPVVLLLHGFPSSSFQYRNLIPLLATKYRVIAPDLPGFGYTAVSNTTNYEYTFAALTGTVAGLLDALSIEKFAMYVFDYGAPIGFRLALQRPDAVTAIISQNGNAYEDGLNTPYWAGLRAACADLSAENIKRLHSNTSFERVKAKYLTGAPDPSAISPETYEHDYALLQRHGNAQIQLSLVRDLQVNVALYPAFHAYFRERQLPLLAVWGRNDTYLTPAGAEAFRRDLPGAVVKFVDGGHFALESHLREISSEVMAFLADVNA